MLIARPMVSYASFVSGEVSTGAIPTPKVTKVACLLTTGALKSAPTIALEVILNLPHLFDTVKKKAAQFTVGMLY
jgi:hypothetical protein